MSGDGLREDAGEVEGLAEMLADWLDIRSDDTPRDTARRILASDWLASHDRKVKADTAERIAQAIEADAQRPSSTNHRAYAGHFAAIARGEAG